MFICAYIFYAPLAGEWCEVKRNKAENSHAYALWNEMIISVFSNYE